jgi:hypothetical protein
MTYDFIKNLRKLIDTFATDNPPRRQKRSSSKPFA